MKNTINAQVICKKNNANTLDFYLKVHDREMYLFTTKYFSNVIYQKYYNGIRIEDAYKRSNMIRQQKLNERILRITKFISDTYDLDLFDNSQLHRSRLDDERDIA